MKSYIDRLSGIIVFIFISFFTPHLSASIDCDIYILGEANGWTAKEAYRFKTTANPDVIYLSLPKLSGQFKIADPTWQKYNYGGALYTTSNLCTVGFGTYTCVLTGENFMAETMTDVTLVFDHRISYAPILEVMPTAMFSADTYNITPQSPYFLRGTLHGYNWATDDIYRFTPTDEEGVYSLFVKELYGEFKISDESWKENYGAESIAIDTWTSLVPNGCNISTPHLTDACITLNLRDKNNPKIKVSGNNYTGSSVPSGIYLMSKMMDSNWKAEPQYEFRHELGSDIHTLAVSTLYDGFKFGDPAYSVYNLGNTGSNGWMQIDGPGTYNLKTNGDSFGCPPMTDLIITLDLSDKAHPKYTISKNTNASTAWKDNFTLQYAEEFNTSTLNRDRWLPYDGPADWEGALSVFTDRPENVSVSDGALNLTVRRENYNGREITSGGIRSFKKWVFRYGRLDIRMQQPPTDNGLCVALWLVGYHYSWPSSGEIDILEQGQGYTIEDGNTPNAFVSGTPCGPYQNSFAYTYGRHVVVPYSVQDGEYHLYTMFWDKNRLLFYLDYDKYPDAEPFYAQIIRQDHPEDPYHGANYFHHPYFVILHIAAQQTAPQAYVVTTDDVTALNDLNNHQATMKVDYVRLYQQGNPEDLLEFTVPGDDLSSIEDTAESDFISEGPEGVTYYNLLGIKVKEDTPGLLIKKSGTHAIKIINR